ncbi:cyclic nucleotide-binding domain-containing protein [Pirellulales bacterium]|nr:cyclic nucleotide-binding domain-containing protein [Pirellulales bacterium]
MRKELRRLRSVGVLGMLSPEYLQKIGGDHDEQIYASGEQIIRQGDPGASMFFIIDGEVVVSLNALGEEQIQLRRLQSGDYFREMSLMTGEPR